MSDSARFIIDLTNDSDVEVDVGEDLWIEIADDTQKPPPPDMNAPDVWTVQRILNTKLTAAGRVYLVKWFGYPIEEATWEHEDNLDCDAALAQYRQRLSNAITLS